MKEPFCKNCKLYNFQKGYCEVIVLYEGQKIHPPTEPEDKCIFEEEYVFKDKNGKKEVWTPEVKEVKMWAENPTTGEKIGKDEKGIVKIEYPEGFFGNK